MFGLGQKPWNETVRLIEPAVVPPGWLCLEGVVTYGIYPECRSPFHVTLTEQNQTLPAIVIRAHWFRRHRRIKSANKFLSYFYWDSVHIYVGLLNCFAEINGHGTK